MTHLKLENNQYWAKYVYTYYFTTTTILTVGYGDITPKNPAEVIIVVLVEIFGIFYVIYRNRYFWLCGELNRALYIISKKKSLSYR